MTTDRVPAWFIALVPDADPDQVYRVFRDLLENQPMSHTELASKIGVTQPAVSRWATGAAMPSLEGMLKAVEVIAERTAEIQKRVDHTQELLLLLREAVELYGRQSREGKPAHGEEWDKIAQRLSRILQAV